MKQLIIIILLISNYCFSQNSNINLIVEISNFKNDKGKVYIQLFDAKGKEIKGFTQTISGKKAKIEISGLKADKYGIRYFHDENSNGKIDFNWMHIPTEGYGYSNNATGTFGPPDFEKWVFELKENKKLDLKVTYF